MTEEVKKETPKTKLPGLPPLVFFSGTLYPLNFFKRILGGRDSDLTCEFESPYDNDRLAIVAYDGIETRYSRRKETLFDVAKVIKATVSQRKGTYLVFAPSYF